MFRAGVFQNLNHFRALVSQYYLTLTHESAGRRGEPSATCGFAPAACGMRTHVSRCRPGSAMPGLFGGKNPGETWRAICYFTGNPPTQSAEEPKKGYHSHGGLSSPPETLSGCSSVSSMPSSSAQHAPTARLRVVAGASSDALSRNQRSDAKNCLKFGDFGCHFSTRATPHPHLSR